MFNGNNVSSSQSIVSEFFSRNFPNGQHIIRGTTTSQRGVASKTLTSQSIESTVSFQNMFRDPRFVLTQRPRMIQSSLNNIITSGIESAYSGANLSIRDPEDPEGTRVLTGAEAANRILLNSTISTNASLDFIANDAAYLNQIANVSVAAANGYTVVGADGRLISHGPNSVDSSTGTTVPSAGNRMVLLDSSFGPNEKDWYLERARLVDEQSLCRPAVAPGFPFDIPDGLTDLGTGGTYFENVTGGPDSYVEVPDELIELSVSTAYVAPVVLEFLLYFASDNVDLDLHSPGTGIHRANNMSTTGGANMSSVESGDGLSAHTMGRALDISRITNRDGTIGGQTGVDAASYKVALELLLDELDSIGASMPYLLPDLLVIHPEVAAEYGVTEGNEPMDTVVKQRYPNLKYVNFHTDSDHDDHVHISWAPQRSGIYTGPGGTMGERPSSTIPAGGSSHMPTSIGDAIGTYTNPRFMSSYLSNTSNSLTPEEIAEMLYGTWCSLEAACLFAAIAQRESSRQPTAINPNISTADYSVGLWQINLFKAWGNVTFHLFLDQEAQSLHSGVTELGWRLGNRNWQADGWTASNFNDRFIQLGNSGMSDAELRAIANGSLWVPINQAYMLYTLCKRGNPPAPNVFSASDRLAVEPEDGYIFSPWGDYGSGENDLVTGWIYGVKYKVAYDAYVKLGGVGSALTDWVIAMFETDGAGSRSAPFAEQWVQGYMFTRTSTNGTITDETRIS